MPRKSPCHDRHPALEAVGAPIRTLRTEGSQSQDALALAAGIDRSYLGGVARGEHNLALVKLIKVSDAIGVPASELLHRAGL
jgi:transcriptional regulator with XRE-family HTH domain